MITTRLNLDMREKEQLAGILHCATEELENELESYSAAALEEYCRMILGQKVFRRTQDIKEYRLYLLIKEVFSNKIPDDQEISNLFQTTPSESRSLVRSITSKYQYELQSAIQDTLIEIIRRATYNENEETYTVTINSTTKIQELNNIIASLDGTLPMINKKRGTVSSYVIKASSYIALCNHFNISYE
jgi:hypothetical protein